MGRYLLFFLFIATCCAARASADPQDIATTSAPVIWTRIGQGSLTVRTWDRPDVQVNANPDVTVRHIPQERLAGKQLPRAMFTFWYQQMPAPDGSTLSLPPEPFPVAPLDAQPHDAVRIAGEGNVAITIPSGSPIVIANVGEGDVSINGYHGGTLVSHVGKGALTLNNFSGTVGAQVNNGRFAASNSQFDRIRVRSVRGLVSFRNCDSRQIEVTTLASSIVYDNGRFEASGPARFESQLGNVAVGVAGGGAQVDAHSASGRVLTEGAVRGGPVVTATSVRGNVGYFAGSINQHPAIRQQLQARGIRQQLKPPKRPRRFDGSIPAPRPTGRPHRTSPRAVVRPQTP